jgi:uncharacterized protein YndB with AHSA1/START domain
VCTEVGVDPATAFAVFTEEIGSWWCMGRDLGRGRKPPTGTMCFEPGVGGRLLEVYGEGEPFQVGRVLVWEPHDRLVFEYRQGNFDPDQITEVEVRFEPAAGGTRVTLQHRGFDALPLDHSARHGLAKTEAFSEMWEAIWTDMLTALADQAGGG